MIDSPYLPYAFVLLIAVPFLFLFRHFVFNFISLKNQELKMQAIKGSSEQRIHAYERLTLYLERLKPANLVTKFDPNLAVHEFLFLTEKTINEEFEYNASQQLYLSKISWSNVVTSKNNVIHLLHKTYDSISNDATLQEFKTVFLMNYVNGEDYISQTLDDLRKENLIIN
ncbi:DUF7935 family protein [Chryseobacterium koreense]|uniref:Uncharacterized protein n=1 Tax=Chryseobacterium koreense CCUG 49689 TaxID=1304281 RepID=A0A0J7J2I7_9FLAO|nr:hypothetical protein [Chryseobacterium koreense]KMQ72588.1 hypothetical protein ACM44_00355 [Chryseobacterium koreense CCUG 49689]MBB5332974.1 hypothetical protein [Chryseobacterium koreense]